MVPHCPNAQECLDISSRIEREFLRGVENAEELAKVIDPGMIFMKLAFFFLAGVSRTLFAISVLINATCH